MTNQQLPIEIRQTEADREVTRLRARADWLLWVDSRRVAPSDLDRQHGTLEHA